MINVLRNTSKSTCYYKKVLSIITNKLLSSNKIMQLQLIKSVFEPPKDCVIGVPCDLEAVNNVGENFLQIK